MCGFVVVYCGKGGILEKKSKIIDAGNLMSHRGPDDAKGYFDNSIGMYFRRLSILDLSSNASQPFTSESGELVLVFNGEIYNYRELKTSLEKKGHRFFTSSDTEVLLKVYEEYGDSAVNYLRGMFAFVIWNKSTGELKAFRDRFGIKPLYIYRNRETIVFSSEIKAILSLQPESRVLDKESAFKYISRNFVDDSIDTFYQDIKSVKPSTFITIRKGVVTEKKYWNLEWGENKKFDGDNFRSTYDEAISLHLRSDVNVAASLSGGMDSSSIVGSIAKNNFLTNKLQTFSVIPPGTCDESFWINKMVEFAEVDHEYVNVSINDPTRVVDDLINLHDEPFQYSSCIYQYLLRENLAKNNIKVLLVGEGGDEVLAGYKRMFFSYLHALYGKMDLNSFIKNLNKGRTMFGYKSTDDFLNHFLQYENILKNNLSGQENNSALDLLDSAIVEKYSHIINEPIYINSYEYSSNSFFELLNKHIFDKNLPHVLRIEDRNSMGKSIESRVPFLDHKLVEMVFSHDVSEFMKYGENKSMLRRAMSPYLPDEIINRKSKSNRPGSNALIVYKLLKDRIIDLIKRRSGDLYIFWGTDLLDKFKQDSSAYSLQRADTWFRFYVFERWREINKITK